MLFERKVAKLLINVPVSEQTKPTIKAMISSKGHRLCEVGSAEVSTQTRAKTVAGMAAPIMKVVAINRVLLNILEQAAATGTTSNSISYNVLGNETFEYGICQ